MNIEQKISDLLLRFAKLEFYLRAPLKTLGFVRVPRSRLERWFPRPCPGGLELPSGPLRAAPGAKRNAPVTAVAFRNCLLRPALFRPGPACFSFFLRG